MCTYITNIKNAHNSTIFWCDLSYSVARDTPDSDNDAMCAELKKDEGWKKSMNNSRPVSISSEPEKKWVDIVSGN